MGSKSSSATKQSSTRGGDAQFTDLEVGGNIVQGVTGSEITVESLDDDVVAAAFEFAEELGVEAIGGASEVNRIVSDNARDVSLAAFDTAEDLTNESFELSRDFGESAATFASNTVSQVTGFSRDAISKIEESTRSDLENVTLQTSRLFIIGGAILAGIYLFRRK